MIKRDLGSKIREFAAKMPVLALVGPRQSGKTTLVKATFPDYTYVSLEDLDIRNYALDDPRGFFADYSNKVIFDEVQKVPELFSYLQTIVDQDDQPGRFILTGSQNFLLMENITQTLAGRIALFTLLPLSSSELQNSVYTSETLEEMLFRGFYPRIYKSGLDPKQWYADYIQTYIERDLRQIKNVNNLRQFDTFIKSCASRTGQLLNLSSLANDCGITHNTAKSWISILEACFVVFLLQPYHGNFGRQLTKSPKLYFYDSGVVCSLLRIENVSQLKTHYIKGQLFESFVITELLKYFYNNKLTPNLYFWRDKVGHEIDCLIKTSNGVTPIEIKSGKTINSSFVKGINYWNKLIKDGSADSYVVYGGDRTERCSEASILAWHELLKIVSEI